MRYQRERVVRVMLRCARAELWGMCVERNNLQLNSTQHFLKAYHVERTVLDMTIRGVKSFNLFSHGTFGLNFNEKIRTS